MTNNQESNFFIPILSAIAGIGAIATVFSPFIIQNDKVGNLFINPNSTQLASVVAIIISIISIWYASSNHSFDTFPADRPMHFKLLLLFSLLVVLFYSSKQLSDNNVINQDSLSILQFCLYIFGYLILGSIIGILLRDSFGGYKYQKIQSEKYDRIREALFKSGLLKATLEIISITQRPYNNNEPQFFGAYNAVFKTDKGPYFAIISSDFSQILHSEEIKKDTNNNMSKK